MQQPTAIVIDSPHYQTARLTQSGGELSRRALSRGMGQACSSTGTCDKGSQRPQRSERCQPPSFRPGPFSGCLPALSIWQDRHKHSTASPLSLPPAGDIPVTTKTEHPKQLRHRGTLNSSTPAAPSIILIYLIHLNFICTFSHVTYTNITYYDYAALNSTPQKTHPCSKPQNL